MRVYVPLVLLVGTIVVLAPTAPPVQKVPWRDQGVFLYMGQQILEGKVPYRDVWDHKGPVVYYINALGLWLGGGSLWGVWLLELVFLGLAACFSFVLLLRVFGPLPAWFGSISWLLSYALVGEGGNWVETYALPLQFLALLLFLQIEGSRLWPAFLIGASGAVTFLLRPDIIGVPLAITLFLAVSGATSRRWCWALARIVVILAGFAAALILGLLYFWAHDALDELLDAVFRYNLAYASPSILRRVSAGFHGLDALDGIGVLSIAAWIAGCAYALARDANARLPTLVLLTLLLLPIEFVLDAISGHGYAHYYVNLLPVLSILAAFFAWELGNRLGEHSIAIKSHTARLSSIWILALLVAINLAPLGHIMRSATESVRRSDDRLKPIEFVASQTDKDDYVLMWGAESVINFMTNRPSPSRYVYQYPLYTIGYQSQEIVDEFLQDIEAKRPVIIDTSPTNSAIPPIADVEQRDWVSGRDYLGLSPEMDVLLAFLGANYEPVARIMPPGWVVYEYTTSIQP